jgi:hypothetical protein
LVLGPELVTNANTASSWAVGGTNTATQDGSAVKITYVDSNVGALVFLNNGPLSGNLTAGKRYKVSFEARCDVGNSINIVAYDGSTTTSTFALTASYQTFTVYLYFVSGTPYVGRVNDGSFGAGESYWVRNITVRELPGNHATQTTSAKRPKLAARYNLLVGTDTLATQSVTTAATTYTLRFGGTGSIALSGTATGTYSAGTHSITATAGTLTLTVTGSVTTADLRPTSQATGLIGPTYQRVVDAATYDAVGFLPYLQFDGIDDSMSTGSIDFTATDKMTVWAGVRKLSDAARGMVGELSDNANNSFQINAPSAVAPLNNFAFASRGSVFPGFAQGNGYVSPISGVLTGIGEISTDANILRINGVQVDANTLDQGTGNYGNYPLYIGMRNNTLFPFNGWLTSLIVRGAQSTQSQIEATESWVNGKTGAY